MLQSLLAYLLTACGEDRKGVIPAPELVERFAIPADQLEEHLSLLNLVNFGGGCYAVYAELHGDEVHVDKELFGDTFRRPPRLTPLEARAIRLALEFVGPMIAAGAHSPLERVRAKLEETFGAVRALADAGAARRRGGGPRRRSSPRAIDAHRLVEIEYLKPEEQEVVTRTVEPYAIERRLPHWYVHTWDVERDQPRSYRLDRMRKAKMLASRSAARGLRSVRAHSGRRPRASGTRRRWRAGRSRRARRPLVDGAALAEKAVGSAEWLVGEVVSYRGEAIVLEPHELRARVAPRARELASELRPSRARA